MKIQESIRLEFMHKLTDNMPIKYTLGTQFEVVINSTQINLTNYYSWEWS